MIEVLIVGGGPVGLMTALGLARAGVPVTVLEAEQSVVYSPRAISYAWTILPGLELLGVFDDMMAAGHAIDERCWRIFKTGEAIVYNHDAVRDLTDRPFSLTLGQDVLAQVLLTHLKRHPNVTIRWGTAFTGLVQTPTHVIVKADTSDGPLELQAKWVVAADGGRSAVRKAVGLTLDGFTWPQRFVATNIRFDFEKHGWGSGYLVDPVYGAVIYKIDTDGCGGSPLPKTIRGRSNPSNNAFGPSRRPCCRGTRISSLCSIPNTTCTSARQPPIASGASCSPAMRPMSRTRPAVSA